MTIYTWMRNKDANDGTASLEITSGTVEIGTWGDFTDSEYTFFSQKCILYPGELHPDVSGFPWQRNNQPGFIGGSGSGGGGGSGPTYTWITPGVSTAADLPSGSSINDVTLTLDTQTLYYWDGTQWKSLAVFGSGGSGGGGLPSILSGGNASTTSFVAILSGGNASTTSFTQIINGGSA